MIIRKMEEKDLEAVCAICMDSFLQSVAGTLSDEGITTFSNIAACGAFLDRMKGDNLMLVAENDENVEGVIELKEGRHVAMLFIRLWSSNLTRQCTRQARDCSAGLRRPAVSSQDSGRDRGRCLSLITPSLSIMRRRRALASRSTCAESD